MAVASPSEAVVYARDVGVEVVPICGSWGHVVMIGADIVEVVEVVAEGLCAASVTVAKVVGHFGEGDVHTIVFRGVA